MDNQAVLDRETGLVWEHRVMHTLQSPLDFSESYEPIIP